MRNLKGKNKTFVILFFIFVFLFSTIFFGVLPMVRKVYAKKDLLEKSKIILERDYQNSERYLKDFSYLNQNSNLTDGLKINEQSRIELIKEMEEMSSIQNLELKIDTFGSKNQKEKDDTELKLSIKGDYKEFLFFLYKLQNFRYAIEIKNLKIEGFDYSKIKNFNNKEVDLNKIPEIEVEIIVSFKEKKDEA